MLAFNKSKKELQDLKDGPTKNRSCTDVFCCMIFVAFWAVSLYVAAESLLKGDLSKIARPYDNDGNPCGYINTKTEANATAYPFLFINIANYFQGNPLLSQTSCVSECPTDYNQTLNCMTNSNVTDCRYLITYPTTEFLGGFCLPTDQGMLATIGKLFSGFNIEAILNSVWLNRWIIVSCIGLAFLLGYFFSLFMQYCTWLIVMVSFLGIFGIGGFLSYLAWNKHKDLQDKLSTETDPAIREDLDSDCTFYKYIAIGLWVILGFSFLVLVCLFDRVILAVKVIQAAADFVTDHKEVVFVPIVLILVSGAYTVWWGYGMAGIYSTGDVKFDPNYPWGKITVTEKMKIYIYIHGFALLWNIAFLLGVSHFLLACSTAIWYFNRQDIERPNPLLRSIWWLFRYHLGSVAFGSLLLALVWAIQILVTYLHQKLKGINNAQLAQFVMKCLLCLSDCLERFIKFFNKHAYIEIALRSKNFCTSAMNGMQVVLNNFLRFGVLHGLGHVVMTFVVFFMTFVGVMIGYAIISAYSKEESKMEGIGACLIVIGVIMFAVARLFSHIWEVSADSFLHCHCIDEELEGGVARRSTNRLDAALKDAADDQKAKGYK